MACPTIHSRPVNRHSVLLSSALSRWGSPRPNDLSGRAQRLAILVTLVGTAASGCFYDLDRSSALAPGDVAGQAVRPGGDVASFASVRIEGLPIRTNALPDGHFLVPNVPEGTWRLNAKDDVDGDGWPERSAIVGFRILNTQSATGLFGATETPTRSSVDLGKVVLEGTIRLEGVVEDDTGAGAADARVVVVHDSVPIAGVDAESVRSSGEVESRVATGQDGRFIVPSVAAGTFIVIAYAERESGLFISLPKTVTQFSGAATLVGEDRLVLAPSDQERAVAFDVSPAPNPSADVTLRLRRAGAGSNVPTNDRTATFDGGVWTVDAIPLGPWTVQVLVDGVSTSRLESRFLLPGVGPQSFGSFLVSDGACENCDCDGDGIRGLPQPPSVSVRNTCDGTEASARSIWETCEARCGGGARVCLSSGVVYDCEDDLDGQSDVAEPACYGVDKGGADCDGDGICEVFDPDDRCAAGRICDPEEVVNLCAGGTPIVEEDGGVDVDAGVDAGFDAGLPPDGGVDGGPDDGGTLVDAGPDDAGVVDGGAPDAGVDAGPSGLVLPPSYVGASASEPIVTFQNADLLPLNFGGTVVQIENLSGEAPPPVFPPCAVDRRPPEAIDLFYVRTADDGTCEFITGASGVDLDNNGLLSMAAAPDGGFFTSIYHQDDVVLGVDAAGESVLSNAPDSITFVHYLADGTVESFRSIPINPGVFPFDVTLTSHPLAQGPVAQVAFGDEFAATFDIDGLSVDNGPQATVAIFFDAEWQATNLQLLGDNLVSIALATQPSPTEVVIGGSSSATVFPQTPAEVPSNEGFIGAFSVDGPLWGRRVAGFEGNVAFGADVVTEEFWFALDGRIVNDALVVTTATTANEINVETLTTTPTSKVPAGAASIDIDAETGAILFADNNAVPPGVFMVAPGAASAERLFSSVSTETFTTVRWGNNGAFLVRDEFGDLKYISDVDPNPVTIDGEVEPSFTVDRNNDEAFYSTNGTIHSAFLGSTPGGFSRGVNIDEGLIAHDGAGLVWYSLVNGVGEFRIVDPINLFAPAPFLTVAPLTDARDMVYDASRETLYVLTDSGILVATGVNESSTIDDGIVLAPFGGPAAPIAMGRQRGATVGLVRADDSVDEIAGEGAIHVVHLDGFGEIAEQRHAGTGPGAFKIRALGVRGAGITVGGDIGGVLSFASENGPPQIVRSDDAQAEFATGDPDDEIAVVHFQQTVDGGLSASWARQSESVFFVSGDFQAFADATMAVLVQTEKEVRLSDRIAAVNQGGLTTVWRLGNDGGGTISPPVHSPIVDVGLGGPDGFDPLEIASFEGVRILLSDGYVTSAPLPGLAGTLFAGTNCAFDPGTAFGLLVVKRSFNGSCQWLRAYTGSDLAFDSIAAGIGNHVIIAVGGGEEPVQEYSSVTGGPFTTRVTSGFAITHIADDGSTIAAFEIEAPNDGSLPIRAVAFADGGFGALANVIEDATVFAGGADESTEAVGTLGRLHVVAAVANFDGSARFARMFGGDNDMSLLSAAAAQGGSVLALTSLDAPIGGNWSYLDGAVTLAGGDARAALFRVERDGTIPWISTIAGALFREGVVTTPGGTSFALIADYSGDSGDFTAEFPLGSPPLQALDNPAGATAIIVGDTADGDATFNASIEHIGQGEAVHFNAAGQLSVAIGVNDFDDQNLQVFFPSSYFASELGGALRKKTVWRFSPATFSGLNYAARESFGFQSFAQNFDVIGTPYVEEMVVLQGGGGQAFVRDDGVQRSPATTTHPMLWRLTPTGINKSETPQ